MIIITKLFNDHNPLHLILISEECNNATILLIPPLLIISLAVAEKPSTKLQIAADAHILTSTSESSSN